jgi:HAD superfamily hydrolase (TIGR01509 family)
MLIHLDGPSDGGTGPRGIAKTGSANCANCANSLGVTSLVIFDCDGVLVDSEPLANASFSRALKAQGLDWSAEEAMRRLMGLSLKSALEICEAEIGRKLPDDFLEKMQAVTYQSFRDAPLMPVAGVKDAVLALQAAGVATCVASSGSPEKMHFTLGLTGLWDLFDGHVFSASQVPRGKPFPDLFLHAAIAMDVQPFACTVVEDSVPGVQAARAAGMRALAYAAAPYARPEALQAAGGRLFDDMKQLPDLVLS